MGLSIPGAFVKKAGPRTGADGAARGSALHKALREAAALGRRPGLARDSQPRSTGPGADPSLGQVKDGGPDAGGAAAGLERKPLPTRRAQRLAARAHTHLRAGGRGDAEHKHARSASAELGL